MFVDDCILFGEATLEGSNVLKGILNKYGVVFGQCVNFDKSSIFFSKNTTTSDKMQISLNMGLKMFVNPEKYLGLPNIVGKGKKHRFRI